MTAARPADVEAAAQERISTPSWCAASPSFTAASAFTPAWHLRFWHRSFRRVRRGKGEAAHRQRAAAASEIAHRLGRAAGLAPRPRSDARHRQRHLRPGPLGQIRPRLPDDHGVGLVPALFRDPPRFAPRAAGRARDHRGRLSPGDLGRRRAHRPRRRRDHHRRPAEAGRRDVAEPPRRAPTTGSTARSIRGSTTRQKGAIVIVMQRLHEDDLAGHVMEAGRLGGRLVAGDRGRGRGRMSSRRRSGGGLLPHGRRRAQPGARTALNARAASAPPSGR